LEILIISNDEGFGSDGAEYVSKANLPNLKKLDLSKTKSSVWGA